MAAADVRSFALDSSCMVAAVCAWHEHHAAAARAVDRRLVRGDRLTVPAHALVETYAVLTRLPAPHRLAPADAWALIRTNFVRRRRLVTLAPKAHATVLAAMAADGVGGGRVYDGIIGASAARARVDELLTLNPRHFTATTFKVVDPLFEA